MSVFTADELAYLTGERRLARLATVGADGTPHVVPVGWSYDAASDTVVVTGYSLEQTKKFRDAAGSGRAALVVDDVLPPWQPRGVEIRGAADAVTAPEALIRITPERIISWGLGADDEASGFSRNARSVEVARSDTGR